MTDDYLNVTEVTFGWEYFAESPAMLKIDGHYFLFGSHLTGWDPNDNVYSHAESLSGPWSEWTEFAPVGSNTHRSQVSYILPLGAENAIYIGDRWVKDNLAASTYVWLPLTISGTDVTLDWQDRWSPDLESGTWSAPLDTTRVEGESGDLENGARVISCSECSGSEAAGYIGGDEGGAVTFSNLPGSGTPRATIGIKYRNGNTDTRHATVTVNDVEHELAFLSTRHRSDVTHTSSLHCDLKEGENTISFSNDGGWGPDVDEIVIPVW